MLIPWPHPKLTEETTSEGSNTERRGMYISSAAGSTALSYCGAVDFLNLLPPFQCE